MSIRRLSFVVGLALVIAFVGSRVARADDDPRHAEAEALMKEGVALIEKKKEAEAFEKFRKAYSIYPSANYLFAMATSEQVLGKPIEALRHFRQAMKAGTLHPKNLEKGKRYITDLQTKLGRVVVKAPAGSTLTLDGATYEGSLDEPIDVEPGLHSLGASLGDKHASTSVSVAAAAEETITLTFPSDAPPPIAPPITPATSSEGPNRPFLFAAAGFGAGAVVGAVAAIVFHGQASSAVEDASTLPTVDCRVSTNPECARAKLLRDDRDGADTRTTIAIATAGGLAALGGVFLWLAFRREEGSARAAVLPNVGPTSAGASFLVRY